MASYNKFNIFVANVANGVHNLGSDTLTIALTDTVPVSTNTVIANISQISYANLSSRNITVTSSSQSLGVYSLIANQATLVAAGSVPQFRYVVLYDSTVSGGPLIAWYDYGSELNMITGDQFTVGFDLTNGILQIS